MALGFNEQDLESWGRVHRHPHRVAHPRHRDELAALMEQARASSGPLLGVGLGRSYGDVGLNAEGRVIAFDGLDRFMALDAEAGVLRAEAGVSLDEIIRLLVPRGWYLPVTPGTLKVSLGGAIANDVHGKNHHRAGNFGRYVRRLGLLRSDRGFIEVVRDETPELFQATIGGLGLTGLIVWAEIDLARICSSLVEQWTTPFPNLATFFALSAEAEARSEHVSAWLDCTASGASLGRGVLFAADWAADGPLLAHPVRPAVSVPFQAPHGLMNPVTLQAFNAAYHAWQSARRGRSRLHYRPAFYPLDAVGHWNLLYGPRGFYQHQFVVPPEVQYEAVSEILRIISDAGQGSFLGVLKSLGTAPPEGLVSFHGPGASLALDFPNRGAITLTLLEAIDAVVLQAGGRIYPAKDGRMSAAMFQSGFPRWAELDRMRDPVLGSDFWRRVTA